MDLPKTGPVFETRNSHTADWYNDITSRVCIDIGGTYLGTVGIVLGT